MASYSSTNQSTVTRISANERAPLRSTITYLFLITYSDGEDGGTRGGGDSGGDGGDGGGGGDGGYVNNSTSYSRHLLSLYQPVPWPGQGWFLCYLLVFSQLLAGLMAQLHPHPRHHQVSHQQSSPLSLVEECRGSALIGRELHNVATPALLCHKEPARASKAPY